MAVGRDVLIIPVRKNLDPYGFIGKYQAIQAKGKTIREVAEAIFTTLVHSPKTRQKMLRALAVSISQVTDVDDASSKLEILKSVENIPEEVLIQLREQVKENKVLMVNDAFLATLNMVLASYGVEGMSEDGRQREDEFGDIPF